MLECVNVFPRKPRSNRALRAKTRTGWYENEVAKEMACNPTEQPTPPSSLYFSTNVQQMISGASSEGAYSGNLSEINRLPINTIVAISG
jgi:hypothetical protein